MNRLLIKFPTRNRPEKFKTVYQKYYDYLSGNNEVKFVISMDVDDPTMNNDNIKKWLIDHPSTKKFNYSENKSKIQAVNADLDGEDSDVLLLASDDMIPQIKGYDDIIFDEYFKNFPSFDGAIKFNDGLRNDELMTLCVMGWKNYKDFGYIYHPEYTSLYADTEQTLVFKKKNKLAISPLCIIKHEWTGHPWDALHARNENYEMYVKDKLIFDKHLPEILLK
jgi:hypothetical protein